MGSVPTYSFDNQPRWKKEYGLGPNYPAYEISWDTVLEFIEKLNTLTNQKFRLPTEAEWEFAASGGTLSKGCLYSGSKEICDVAWFRNNSGSSAHVVASKSPNEIGLFDMTGNVWELCSDFYDATYYSNSPTENPKGSLEGNVHIIRGGGFTNDQDYCRIQKRDYIAPHVERESVGFRLAL